MVHTQTKNKLPWKACCQIHSLKAPGQATITYSTDLKSPLISYLEKTCQY